MVLFSYLKIKNKVKRYLSVDETYFVNLEKFYMISLNGWATHIDSNGHHFIALEQRI